MAKQIKACTIQNNSYVLYPKTADVLVINEEGETLKDRLKAINDKIDNIVKGSIDVDMTNCASKDYVNEIIDMLRTSMESEIDLIANQVDDMLDGNKQQEILKLTVDDIGKVLSVAQNDKGELVIKAIDIILNNNDINWEQISNKPEIANKIKLTQESLVLLANENDLSYVPLVKDEDIDSIINEL